MVLPGCLRSPFSLPEGKASADRLLPGVCVCGGGDGGRGAGVILSATG